MFTNIKKGGQFVLSLHEGCATLCCVQTSETETSDLRHENIETFVGEVILHLSNKLESPQTTRVKLLGYCIAANGELIACMHKSDLGFTTYDPQAEDRQHPATWSEVIKISLNSEPMKDAFIEQSLINEGRAQVALLFEVVDRE